MNEERDIPEEIPEEQNLSDETTLPTGQEGLSTNPINQAEQHKTHNSEFITNDPTDEKTSSTEPITKAEPPSTLTPKPSTPKDMEVHHHGHVHETKKWKEYIFQFLMLFLAVFCGFLAEYQLEHVIEHNREKQFINSLVTDLQDDVKGLDAIILLEQEGIAKLDTLIDLLNNPQLAKQEGDKLYYVARIGPRSIPFANNSRTFDQLKNSGGFRLIRKTQASNNIMGYYNQFSWIRLLEDNYNHEFDNYKRVGAKILDPVILRRQEEANGEILRSTDNPILQTYERALLKELGFHTLQMNGSRRSKVLLFEKLKKSAEELIAYLKENYHLD